MKSKTLSLIAKYQRELLEQVDPNAPQEEVPTEDPAAPAPAPEAQEPVVLQMTSDAEDDYIRLIIKAALSAPNDNDRRALLTLQEIMRDKEKAGVTNARTEVLDIVLPIIQSDTNDDTLRSQMNEV